MMVKNPSRGPGGFTVLEAVISLTVLMVLVSSVTTLLVHFRRGTAQVEEEARARCIASGLLTRVRASSPPSELPGTEVLDLTDETALPPGGKAHVEWEEYSESLARASIRLRWTGRRGERMIEMTTLVERKE